MTDRVHRTVTCDRADNILEKSEKLTFLNALKDGGVFLMYLVWWPSRSSDFAFDEQFFVVT